ncbi:unnamed protein product, partial [Darwinula stevensoni]
IDRKDIDSNGGDGDSFVPPRLEVPLFDTARRNLEKSTWDSRVPPGPKGFKVGLYRRPIASSHRSAVNRCSRGTGTDGMEVGTDGMEVGTDGMEVGTDGMEDESADGLNVFSPRSDLIGRRHPSSREKSEKTVENGGSKMEALGSTTTESRDFLLFLRFPFSRGRNDTSTRWKVRPVATESGDLGDRSNDDTNGTDVVGIVAFLRSGVPIGAESGFREILSFALASMRNHPKDPSENCFSRLSRRIRIGSFYSTEVDERPSDCLEKLSRSLKYRYVQRQFVIRRLDEVGLPTRLPTRFHTRLPTRLLIRFPTRLSTLPPFTGCYGSRASTAPSSVDVSAGIGIRIESSPVPLSFRDPESARNDRDLFRYGRFRSRPSSCDLGSSASRERLVPRKGTVRESGVTGNGGNPRSLGDASARESSVSKIERSRERERKEEVGKFGIPSVRRCYRSFPTSRFVPPRFCRAIHGRHFLSARFLETSPVLPSFRPSVLPSFRPSVLPSFRPSVLPSFRPSALPSHPEARRRVKAFALASVRLSHRSATVANHEPSSFFFGLPSSIMDRLRFLSPSPLMVFCANESSSGRSRRLLLSFGRHPRSLERLLSFSCVPLRLAPSASTKSPPFTFGRKREQKGSAEKRRTLPSPRSSVIAFHRGVSLGAPESDGIVFAPVTSKSHVSTARSEKDADERFANVVFEKGVSTRVPSGHPSSREGSNDELHRGRERERWRSGPEDGATPVRRTVDLPYGMSGGEEGGGSNWTSNVYPGLGAIPWMFSSQEECEAFYANITFGFVARTKILTTEAGRRRSSRYGESISDGAGIGPRCFPHPARSFHSATTRKRVPILRRIGSREVTRRKESPESFRLGGSSEDGSTS